MSDTPVSFDITCQIYANGKYFEKSINCRGRSEAIYFFRLALQEIDQEIKQYKEQK